MPFRVADQSRVPMPSENSSTLTRKSFASAKWPASWGPMRRRNMPTTASAPTSQLTIWVTRKPYPRFV